MKYLSDYEKIKNSRVRACVYLSSSEELEAVSRGCWVGAVPTYRVPAPHSGDVTSRTLQSLESEWRSQAEGL